MAESNFEKRERNPQVLLEEIKRLTDTYYATEKEAQNFPEVKKTLVSNISMLVEKLEEMDPSLVPEEAKKILAEQKEEKNNREE